MNDHSDRPVKGKQYRDVFQGDNEPILRATKIEIIPSSGRSRGQVCDGGGVERFGVGKSNGCPAP
jgi:hypothetical protein